MVRVFVAWHWHSSDILHCFIVSYTVYCLYDCLGCVEEGRRATDRGRQTDRQTDSSVAALSQQQQDNLSASPQPPAATAVAVAHTILRSSPCHRTCLYFLSHLKTTALKEGSCSPGNNGCSYGYPARGDQEVPDGLKGCCSVRRRNPPPSPGGASSSDRGW